MKTVYFLISRLIILTTLAIWTTQFTWTTHLDHLVYPDHPITLITLTNLTTRQSCWKYGVRDIKGNKILEQTCIKTPHLWALLPCHLCPCISLQCASAVSLLMALTRQQTKEMEMLMWHTLSQQIRSPSKDIPIKTKSILPCNAWNENLEDRIYSFPRCVIFIMFTSRRSVTYPLS